MITVLTDEGWATKRGGRWQVETLRKIVARMEVAA